MTGRSRRARPAGGNRRTGYRGSRPGHRRTGSRTRRDQGSAALEFLGVLPVLLLVALAGIQLGLVAYTASQAGTAARAAARAAAKYQAGVSGEAAGQAAVSDWLTASVGVVAGPDAVRATADVDIPSVFPGWTPGSIERSATMPREDVSTP
jgi:Flp pilus assembly protein TadG